MCSQPAIRCVREPGTELALFELLRGGVGTSGNLQVELSPTSRNAVEATQLDAETLSVSSNFKPNHVFPTGGNKVLVQSTYACFEKRVEVTKTVSAERLNQRLVLPRLDAEDGSRKGGVRGTPSLTASGAALQSQRWQRLWRQQRRGLPRQRWRPAKGPPERQIPKGKYTFRQTTPMVPRGYASGRPDSRVRSQILPIFIHAGAGIRVLAYEATHFAESGSVAGGVRQI